jgi:hypothetical protein
MDGKSCCKGTKKNAEVLVYPQKNLTFAPLKEKLRYANEK